MKRKGDFYLYIYAISTAKTNFEKIDQQNPHSLEVHRGPQANVNDRRFLRNS